MKKSHHARIRALLRDNPDGMTVAEMAHELEIGYQTLRLSVRSMPDTYIDRWVDNGMRCWSAVYCAVPVPEDAPMPDIRPSQRRASVRAALQLARA